MQTKTNIVSKKNRLWLFSMYFGHACGCHQKPSRSFFIKNYQFFLCYRCTGIMFAELIVSPIFYLLNLHFGFYTFLFVIPMLIDGGIQYVFKIESNHIRRLTTGILAGYGIGISIIHLIMVTINIL
ncbi:MAG: DUF2085 domain-containing protein [Acholeplasmataceae bacterium]